MQTKTTRNKSNRPTSDNPCHYTISVEIDRSRIKADNQQLFKLNFHQILTEASIVEVTPRALANKIDRTRFCPGQSSKLCHNRQSSVQSSSHMSKGYFTYSKSNNLAALLGTNIGFMTLEEV